MQHFGAFDAGKQIFGAYDQFLALVNDDTKRTQLEKLGVEDAAKDAVFQEARTIGTTFQAGLIKLFFETNDELTKATQRYGVF